MWFSFPSPSPRFHVHIFTRYRNHRFRRSDPSFRCDHRLPPTAGGSLGVPHPPTPGRRGQHEAARCVPLGGCRAPGRVCPARPLRGLGARGRRSPPGRLPTSSRGEPATLRSAPGLPARPARSRREAPSRGLPAPPALPADPAVRRRDRSRRFSCPARQLPAARDPGQTSGPGAAPERSPSRNPAAKPGPGRERAGGSEWHRPAAAPGAVTPSPRPPPARLPRRRRGRRAPSAGRRGRALTPSSGPRRPGGRDVGAPFSRPAGPRQSVGEQEPRAQPARARPSARRRPGAGSAARAEAAGGTRAASAPAPAPGTAAPEARVPSPGRRTKPAQPPARRADFGSAGAPSAPFRSRASFERGRRQGRGILAPRPPAPRAAGVGTSATVGTRSV
ncbi:hypothetical protein R6Z07M_018253 [Ovis aries]